MCNCKHNGVNGKLCCHETNVKETLGLVATSARNVIDGSQYDSFFPKANFKDKIINPDGSVKYTVEQMEKVVADYNWQTKQIARELKKEQVADTLEAIWNFLYKHIPYKLDKEGVEELRTPARSWHDGQILGRNPATKHLAGIDCDCYSIFVSCILTNLEIKHKLRVTKYGAGWQHVYVVVPVANKPSHNWIIDCVLDKFNIEKTYTDKFDYTMETTLGIPVAVLSGMKNESELNGITSGSDFNTFGFGAVSDPNDELGALKRHMVRTRNFIKNNPQSVVYQGGAANNLKMLDHAINNFDTPNRMKALTEVAQAEHDMNVEMGLASPKDFDANESFDGIEDENFQGTDDKDGTDDLADDVNVLGKTKAPKKFFQNVRKAAGNATNRAKTGVKKAVNSKVFKKVVRYNPLTAAARGGFLLVMKEGWFDLAWAVAPGYFTADEAKSKGVNEDRRQRAIKALDKITKIFVNTLQGKPENLKKAILAGAKKRGLSGDVEVLGQIIESLGVEPATTTTAVAASAVPVTSAASAATAAGLTTKNGKSIVKAVIDFFKRNKSKIRNAAQEGKKAGKVIKAAKDKRDAKKAANSPTPESETPESGTDNSAPESSNNSASEKDTQTTTDVEKVAENAADVAEKVAEEGEDSGQSADGTNAKNQSPAAKDNSATTPTNKEGFFSKVKTFAKENPGTTTAIAVITTGALVLTVSPKARQAVKNALTGKKSKGVSGVGKRKRNTKRRATGTKRKRYVKI